MADALNCVDCGGELEVEVSGAWESWHRGAVCAYDLSPLLSSPEVRGDSVLIRGTDGRSARRRRPDETTHVLPLMFSGAVDETGTAAINQAHQVDANRRWFISTFVDPPGTTAGTRPARITLPDSTVVTADIIVARLLYQIRVGNYGSGTVRVTIPDGQFS